MRAAEKNHPSRGLVVRRLVVSNLGCIDRLRLDLDGLTVLIGENGTGKSTILECFELLRRANQATCTPPDSIRLARGSHLTLGMAAASGAQMRENIWHRRCGTFLGQH